MNIEDALVASEQAETQGDLKKALKILQHVASLPEATPEVFFKLARIQSDLGNISDAIESLKNALERDSTHQESLELLVELARLSENPSIAQEYLERAKHKGAREDEVAYLSAILTRAQLSTTCFVEPQEALHDMELVPDDSDLVRFLAFFGGREDVYARQWYSPSKDRSGYSPVHEPLTPSVLKRHFLGEVTLGVYPVRLDGYCVFSAIDIDIYPSVLDTARADHAFAKRLATKLLEATTIARKLLKELGFCVVVEDSGYKGRHLWLLFDAPVPAKMLRELSAPLLTYLRKFIDGDLLSLEFFPKQSEVKGAGLGNLIKLPLGIHRKSGKRSVFLDEDFAPIRRPFTYLRSLVRAEAGVVARALAEIQTRLEKDFRTSTGEAQHEEKDMGEKEKVEEALPAPPAPPPVWTEADFDNDPEVSFLLSRCNVLYALVRMAIEHQNLRRDALLVLRHTLGHFESGLLAYNYLHEKVKGIETDKLVSTLKGNPVSCAKIRARLPEVVKGVQCECNFSWAPNTYPNPVLHLQDPAFNKEKQSVFSQGDVAEADIEGLVRRFLHLVRRIRELERERNQFAIQVAMALRALPEASFALDEGRLSLTLEDGIEVLKWMPAGVEEAPPVGGGEGEAKIIPLPVPMFKVVVGEKKSEDKKVEK
jgi:hypothetical protein